MSLNISALLANELQVKNTQIDAAVQLLDDGSTVPFISRYRKEVTGALDDTQLRQIQTRLQYLRQLEERKAIILSKIGDLGKLTAPLSEQIKNCLSKTELEELYQPFKSTRKTKALLAKEAGLDALLQQIISHPLQDPITLAKPFLAKHQDFTTAEQCLEGASAILSQMVMEQREVISSLRSLIWQTGEIHSKATKQQDVEEKFRDYYEFSQKLHAVPSHRMLALLRGVAEGCLKLDIQLAVDADYCVNIINQQMGLTLKGVGGSWLNDTLHSCWKKKIKPKLDKELVNRQRNQAEHEAIKVFSRNLKELLLSAPAGDKVTLGLDPGLRTGVKVAVISDTGKLLDHSTIYPHAPKNRWRESKDQLAKLCLQHKVELISIGNGTGSRETDKLVSELLPEHSIRAQKVMVSEAGASVYSASEYAAKEFPDLDVTIRGAVSIARRLQDPLAELVKIEPKAIGVGQYQHDVDQTALSEMLENVIEDCVNAVGVDLNSASEALLQRISGLSPTLAKNIIAYRDEHGRFNNRNELKKVPRLGPKAFEQSAAFLRISDGDNPLDNSSVHPESYPFVTSLAEKHQKKISQLIGDIHLLRQLRTAEINSSTIGEYTLKDILQELEKPGRDPRPEFRTAQHKEGVEKISDLSEGMMLEGTVTNVTNFGAFVDIGVHQDGLVHISQLADRFVKNPHDIVKPGQIVKVRVLEADLDRKRISLTMRSETEQRPKTKAGRATQAYTKEQQRPLHKKGNNDGTFARLFEQAKKNVKKRR